MDHNGFRAYVRDVLAFSPGVPIIEEARLYHKDPKSAWKKGSAPEINELYDLMAGIVSKADTDRHTNETKLQFRAILSVLLSHYEISSNTAMAEMQRRKVIA
jgi:hypothetical protein